MLRRLLLGVAVLVALAIAGVALLLPRLADRPEVRERITAAAYDATGRTLSYDTLEVGLLPPRLEIRAAQLAGGPGEDPLGAERIALRVAWLPLLARQILIERIDVDAPQLTLRRTADGFELPFRPPEEPDSPPDPESPRDPSATKDEGFSLLVRRIAVSDARLTLDDRSLTPPATLLIEDADIALELEDLAGSVDFEVAARVAGAPLAVQGSRSAGGEVVVELSVAGLALATLQPWIGDDDFAGNLTVTVKATAQRDAVETAAVRAVLEDAALAFGDVLVSGNLPVTADLSGPFDALAGPVTLELADAEVAVDDTFRKPKGMAGRLAGRLVQAGAERRLEELEIRLHNFVGRGRAVLADAPRLELDAEPFALAGWEQLLPALGETAPSGTLALEGLVLGFGPLRLTGDLKATDLVMPLESGASATLSGRMTGHGDRLEGKGLDLRVAGQPFRVDLDVEGLSGAPTARLRMDADDADSQALLAALAGKEDTLSGPLRLRSDLRAPLTGEGELLERVTGKLRFDIAPGRMKGVSLLKSTFDGLGGVGGAALAAGQLSGKKGVDRFYDDAFERLGGTLTLADGRARSEDLLLDYRDYRVDLRGSVGLVDRGLDLTGKLTISETIDRALAEEGGEAPAPRTRVIPLAAVKGTIDSPKVTVTSEAALGFAAAYAADDRRRAKWERKLDDRLGEGSGREVLDLLDSILQGGAPAAEDPSAPPPSAPPPVGSPRTP